MKNLFEPAQVEGIEQRIGLLHAANERQWGEMTLAQTLAHCTAGLDMAEGVIRSRRAAFPVRILGWIIKPLFFRDDQPMRRNSPSSPELLAKPPAQRVREQERTRLLTKINRFVTQGANHCTAYPHPFFGRLTPGQWGILMYKHLDHHLRQFGV